MLVALCFSRTQSFARGSLGISLSAFVRLLLTKEAGNMSTLDQRLLEIEKEGFEKVDAQEFQSELKKMINNANA